MPFRTIAVFFIAGFRYRVESERVRLGEALADAVADLDELPEARPMTASSSASFQSEDFISAVIFVQVRISH